MTDKNRLVIGEDANWVDRWRAPKGLRAVATGVLILGMIAVVAELVYATGGTAFVWAHLMYVPLVVAAAAFRVNGGIAAALIGGLILGPYMPMDADHGVWQSVQNWIFRIGFFLLVGGMSGFPGLADGGDKEPLSLGDHSRPMNVPPNDFLQMKTRQ